MRLLFLYRSMCSGEMRRPVNGPISVPALIHVLEKIPKPSPARRTETTWSYCQTHLLLLSHRKHHWHYREKNNTATVWLKASHGLSPSVHSRLWFWREKCFVMSAGSSPVSNTNFIFLIFIFIGTTRSKHIHDTAFTTWASLLLYKHTTQ